MSLSQWHNLLSKPIPKESAFFNARPLSCVRKEVFYSKKDNTETTHPEPYQNTIIVVYKSQYDNIRSSNTDLFKYFQKISKHSYFQDLSLRLDTNNFGSFRTILPCLISWEKKSKDKWKYVVRFNYRFFSVNFMSHKNLSL